MEIRPPESPAKRLRALRERAGLSLEALAQAAGYSGASSLQRYEDETAYSDRFFPLRVLDRIAPALIGRGDPPITAEEVYILGNVMPPQSPGGRVQIASPPPAPIARAKPAPGEAIVPASETGNTPFREIFPNAPRSGYGGRNLPIYGAGKGGSEGFLNNDVTQAVDWTHTPPELEGVRDAFALYVDGDSMTDAGLRDGNTIHIHPHQRPRPGDFCVIVKTDGETLVKRFEGIGSGKYHLWQSNPPKHFDIPTKQVRAYFLIVSAKFTR